MLFANAILPVQRKQRNSLPASSSGSNAQSKANVCAAKRANRLPRCKTRSVAIPENLEKAARPQLKTVKEKDRAKVRGKDKAKAKEKWPADPDKAQARDKDRVKVRARVMAKVR